MKEQLTALDLEPLPWIPYRHYALMLSIDGAKLIMCGRFCRKTSCQKQVDWLNMYRGYSAHLVDTKKAPA